EGHTPCQTKAAGQEIHRQQGQGGGIRQFLALQGQGGARGPAARRRAALGTVNVQVRPARLQRVRGPRSSVHLPRRGRLQGIRQQRSRQADVRQARHHSRKDPRL